MLAWITKHAKGPTNSKVQSAPHPNLLAASIHSHIAHNREHNVPKNTGSSWYACLMNVMGFNSRQNTPWFKFELQAIASFRYLQNRNSIEMPKNTQVRFLDIHRKGKALTAQHLHPFQLAGHSSSWQENQVISASNFYNLNLTDKRPGSRLRWAWNRIAFRSSHTGMSDSFGIFRSGFWWSILQEKWKNN